MWKILGRIKKGKLYLICPTCSIVAISVIKVMYLNFSRIKICVFLYMKKKFYHIPVENVFFVIDFATVSMQYESEPKL